MAVKAQNTMVNQKDGITCRPLRPAVVNMSLRDAATDNEEPSSTPEKESSSVLGRAALIQVFNFVIVLFLVLPIGKKSLKIYF